MVLHPFSTVQPITKKAAYPTTASKAKNPNNDASLAEIGERRILSDRYCCGPAYAVPMNHESNTEFFLLFVFF